MSRRLLSPSLVSAATVPPCTLALRALVRCPTGAWWSGRPPRNFCHGRPRRWMMPTAANETAGRNCLLMPLLRSNPSESGLEARSCLEIGLLRRFALYLVASPCTAAPRHNKSCQGDQKVQQRLPPVALPLGCLHAQYDNNRPRRPRDSSSGGGSGRRGSISCNIRRRQWE